MNKTSKQRQAILKALQSTKSHPTAEWIYQQVKKQIPNIGLATVYRNLRILIENREIMEIRTSDDTARFDADTRQHYHFRCDRCGKVLDLDVPVDETIESRIARRTGLKITHHYLELGGLCLDCQIRELPRRISKQPPALPRKTAQRAKPG